MVANMVLNLALIVPMAHAGLALATSLSAWLNAFLLWRGLAKDGAWKAQAGAIRFLVQLAIANGVLATVILVLNKPVPVWLADGGLDRTVTMAVLVTAGVLAYFATLFVVGVRIRHFRRR